MTIAATAGAQTPGAASNIKFTRVSQPVPKQVAIGTQQAGEFYHAQYTGAAWGDYNGDGYLDVFYSDRNQHASSSNVQSNLYKNNGDGTFARVTWSPFAGTAFSSPVWFDFNNDGLLDMFVSGVASWGYKWKEEDTNLDALKCHLYINKGNDSNGNATFEEITDCGVKPVFNAMGGKGHMAVAVGDYNKDGYTDMILTGFDEVDRSTKEKTWLATRTCYLYKNVGGKKFELVEAPLANGGQFVGLTDGSVTMVDLDGDTYPDIVANGYDDHYESSLHIYWNMGDGTFVEKESGIKGLTAGIVTVGDIDNDGRPDLIMGGIYENCNRKSMYIARNTGRRNWELVNVDAFEGCDGTQISVGDVNQDGLADLLVGGHGQTHEHTTWIYANQGNFTFEVNGAHYNDTFGKLGHFNRVTHGNQHLIDYDNDGYLDAWSSGWCNGTCGTGCLTEIYHNVSANKGVEANTAPSAPSGLQVAVDSESNLVTFTWTAASDDFTPEAALRYNFYIKRKGSDEVFMILPSDISTGFVRVGNTVGALYTCKYVTKVAESGTYEWGVQAIDNGNKGGLWATATSDINVSGINTVTVSNVAKAWSNGNTLYYNVDDASTMSVYSMDGSLVKTASVTGNGAMAMDVTGAYIIVFKNDKGVYTTKVRF